MIETILKRLADSTFIIEQSHKERNEIIYQLFNSGMKQKSIAFHAKLSTSRVKAICKEQKKKIRDSR
jgi:Mor family transcriptional regulator